MQEARRRFGGVDLPATLVGMPAALALLILIGGLVGAAIGTIGYQSGLNGNHTSLSIAGLAGGIAAGCAHPRHRTGRGTLMNPEADGPDGLTRHEEELQLGTRSVQTGSVRAHKQVTSEQVSVPTTRQVEHFDNVDRVAPNEQDSGQIETLEDGSISIPILEEELVITKRLVVRERVILQKRIELEHQTVEAELRSEHVSIETDDAANAPGQT